MVRLAKNQGVCIVPRANRGSGDAGKKLVVPCTPGRVSREEFGLKPTKLARLVFRGLFSTKTLQNPFDET